MSRKITAVIPARYASTRFPGKPLADIHGKPMIWWVHKQVIQVREFNDVIVATDDERIEKVCKELGINVKMTANTHPTGIDRVHEVSEHIDSDYYVVALGDEPLIKPETIRAILPSEPTPRGGYVASLMTPITDPVEMIDNTNLKVVVDNDGYAIFLSRSPIPYPKKTSDFKYNKYLGITICDKKALDFFVKSPFGRNELIEDINELRFIDNRFLVKMITVDAKTLSVDTPKDLDRVKQIIASTEATYI
jgi:3-deoxy-manno-octulosonate cytidylyltransferase (CMP-KDO synthetase)